MSQFAKRNPNELDSTQTKRRKLEDGMFSQSLTLTAQAGAISREVEVVDVDNEYEEDDVGLNAHIVETTTSLKSIKKLRQLVEKQSDPSKMTRRAASFGKSPADSRFYALQGLMLSLSSINTSGRQTSPPRH